VAATEGPPAHFGDRSHILLLSRTGGVTIDFPRDDVEDFERAEHAV
jgi:hypothetical protein